MERKKRAFNLRPERAQKEGESSGSDPKRKPSWTNEVRGKKLDRRGPTETARDKTAHLGKKVHRHEFEA